MPTATVAETRPAILGGQPAITATPQAQAEANRWPIITRDDEESVLRVLRSGQLSISDETTALEDDYRRWLGVGHAVAHNNGTGAILAALHAFGIGPRDEVIVPSATWWSSVMPIVHLGGVPVFAELEHECLGLDPAHVESRITPRTKAIVAVHLFGMPSKMDELIAVAKKHNLKILEDASHAHGATYKGRPIGKLTDAAVFSMQANKLLPSAEGGMFLTNDAELHEKVLRFGHYERLLGLSSPNKRFAATGFGFKFRMSPLSAAVARSQFRSMGERNARRNANCIRLSQRLEQLGFQTFLAPAGVQRVYFEFLIRYDERTIGLPMKSLVKALQAEGAQVGAPRYPLLHQQPVFTEGVWSKIARLEPTPDWPLRTYDPRDLPQTTVGNGSLIKLPSFPSAGHELLDQYAAAFEKVVHHANDIPREIA
jgi:dTDP-4-amino-4,6-dideoxygalactose transaminase